MINKSNLTKCFWGPTDPERFLHDVKGLLGPLAERGAYCGDNLIVFGRNLSFLSDEEWIASFTKHIHESNYVGYGTMWRLYIYSCLAKMSLKREGDFVECGVSSGTSSILMCDYLHFAQQSKSLFLYDTWGEDKRVSGTPYGFDSDTYRYVTERFSRFPNVKLVKGFVPESFEIAIPAKIAFLHIDLNSADAEISALEHLFDLIVPGGVVLFDDYGFSGFKASKTAEDQWLRERDYLILELPTGQGLLIK